MERLIILPLLPLALLAFLTAPAPAASQSIGPAGTAPAQDVRKTAPPANSDEAEFVVVPDGTPIPLKIVKGFSSESAKAGDVINFAVAFEVRVGELVVIPQRTSLTGSVGSVSHPRRGARNGQVSVTFDALTLPTGETATVRSVLKPPHKAAKVGEGAANAVGTAAELFITAGVPLFVLFEKGDEQIVPEGTVEMVYLNGPLRLSRKAVMALQGDPALAYANVFVNLVGVMRRGEFIVPELYCGEKRILTYRGEPLRLQLRPGSYWFSTDNPKDRPIWMDVLAGREYSVGSDRHGLFAKELPAKPRYYPLRLIDEDWTKLTPEEYRSLAAEPAAREGDSRTKNN
jgi:hypothetical protein